jgi:hypothetical protein
VWNNKRVCNREFLNSFILTPLAAAAAAASADDEQGEMATTFF